MTKLIFAALLVCACGCQQSPDHPRQRLIRIESKVDSLRVEMRQDRIARLRAASKRSAAYADSVCNIPVRKWNPADCDTAYFEHIEGVGWRQVF
jgi:hypothetical protein